MIGSVLIFVLYHLQFPDLDLTVELPKPLSLASVAVRFLIFSFDHLSNPLKDEYMALGPILSVDLCSLPAPPKRVKGWTLRQVTSLMTSVHKLQYPIPPAGTCLLLFCIVGPKTGLCFVPICVQTRKRECDDLGDIENCLIAILFQPI